MTKRIINTLTIIILSIVMLAYPQDKIISVSIPPLGSITRYITGNHWKIFVLLPQNTNPHLFEATPQIMKNIENSSLLILNGKDIDFWAYKLVDKAKKELLIVSDGLSVKDDNPHYWVDPILAKDIAKIIYNKISAIDPKYKDVYLKNLNNFNIKVNALDSLIRKELSKYRKKEIIAFHPSFYYFFNRYNIKVLSYIEEGEGKEPSLKKISEIIRLIKEKNIKYIVKEPFINSPILDSIKRETKVKIVNMDPLGYGKDYFDFMRENLEILKEIFDEQNR